MKQSKKLLAALALAATIIAASTATASTIESSFTGGSTVTEIFGYSDEGDTKQITSIPVDYDPDQVFSASMDVSGDNSQQTTVQDTFVDADEVGAVEQIGTSDLNGYTVGAGTVFYTDYSSGGEVRFFDPNDGDTAPFTPSMCSGDLGGYLPEAGVADPRIMCAVDDTTVVDYPVGSGDLYTSHTYTMDTDNDASTPPYLGDYGYDLDPSTSSNYEMFVVEGGTAHIIDDQLTILRSNSDRSFKHAGPQFVHDPNGNDNSYMSSYAEGDAFNILFESTASSLDDIAVESAADIQPGGFGLPYGNNVYEYYAVDSTEIRAFETGSDIDFIDIADGLDIAELGGVADLDDKPYHDSDGENDHYDRANDIYYLDSSGNLKYLLFDNSPPYDVTVDVGGSQVFSHNGYYDGSDSLDVQTEVENYISNNDCTGGCNIPIDVYSDSIGEVSVSNLDFEYNDIPNPPDPADSGSVDTIQSSNSHAFTVQFTFTDKDGDSDPTGCTVSWQDEDGNTGTVSGSLNTGVGNSEEVQCEATISSSINDIQVDEVVDITDIEVSDSDGSESATVSGVSETVPNNPPTKPTSYTDLGDRVTDTTPQVTWSGHGDPDGDNLLMEGEVRVSGGTFDQDFLIDTTNDGSSDSFELCSGGTTATDCPLQDGQDYEYRLRTHDDPACYDGDNTCEATSSYTSTDSFHINEEPNVFDIRTLDSSNNIVSEFNLSDTVTIRANVTDNEGESTIQGVEATVRHPDDSVEVNNASMSKISSISNGGVYETSYTVGGAVEDVGDYDISIYATDDAPETGSSSDTFQVTETTPPVYKNVTQNTSTISRLDTIGFTGWGKDNVEIDYAYLRTNGSGVFQTEDVYQYAEDISDTYAKASLSYRNTGLGPCTRIDWRMVFNDTSSNTNQTDLSSFSTDCTPPTTKNHTDISDAVNAFTSTDISAWAKDDLGIGYGVIATNQTGSWQNYTSSYSSPQYLEDVKNTYQKASFGWSDTGLQSRTTVGHRVWFNDSTGNWKATTTNSFVADPPPQVNTILVEDADSDRPGDKRVNQKHRARIKANVTDRDGRQDLDDVTVTLYNPDDATTLQPTSMTQDFEISDGYQYTYTYQLPNDEQDAGEWTVNVTANDSVGVETSSESTFIYQYPSVTQSAASQGTAEIYEKVGFDKDINVENPTMSDFLDMVFTANIPTDTVSGDVTLLDSSDTSRSFRIDIPAGEVNATIDRLDAGTETSPTWTLQYNVSAITVDASNKTVTRDGTVQWRKQMNISNDVTDIAGVKAYTDIDDPEETASIDLLLNGQPADESLYNVQRIDQDGDGIDDYMQWTIPTLDEKYNFTVVGNRGEPILTDVEKRVTNAPVPYGTPVNHEWIIEILNENDLSRSRTLTLQMPDDASALQLEDAGVDVSYPEQGPVLRIYFGEDECPTSVSNNPKCFPLLDPNARTELSLLFSTSTVSFTTREENPETQYVNETAEYARNITVTNFAEVEIPAEVTRAIDLGTGGSTVRDLTVYSYDDDIELGDGTVFDETSRAAETYELTIDDLESFETRKYRIEFESSTATADVVARNQLSQRPIQVNNTTQQSNLRFRTYEIESRSPFRVEDMRYTIDLPCLSGEGAVRKVVSVNTGETFNWACTEQSNAELRLGTFETSETKTISVYHNPIIQDDEERVTMDTVTTVLLIIAILMALGFALWQKTK